MAKRKPNYKRRFFVLGFVLLNLYGLLCAVLYFFQENLIFLPTVLPQEHSYTMNHPFEEVFLTTNDGAKLNGLHFTVENPKGVILYYHGNAGDLQRWGQIMNFFIEKEYAVVVMDYRGYGKSTGKKSMSNLYSDAQLWYDFTKENYSEATISLYGRSLGATFATHVASKNNPRNLILESPFYSVAEVGKSRFPFLPVKALLHYTFPTFEYINEVRVPITIYHGTSDQVIAFKQGQRLYESIQQNAKEFISVEGGTHHDLRTHAAYFNTIDESLTR